MRSAETGKPVQLSERLRTLADMVTPGNRVADVGCDHGFVPVYLVQRGISPHVIAADVRPGPLSRAEEHIAERSLEAYIETRLSDGLAEIRAGEADTLICAGMGGRLMRRILEQGEAVARSFRELILQPQSELEEFRGFLRRADYRIAREDILCEDGKYYFFIKAVPGADGPQDGGTPRRLADDADAGGGLHQRLADDADAGGGAPRRLADKYGGLLLRERHPVLREYLEFLRRTYSDVAERIEGQAGASADAGDRTGRRLAEVHAELADIGEAMRYFTK